MMNNSELHNARLQIIDMLTRYTSYADAGKLDKILDLFEPDATLSATGDDVATGRAEITAHFERNGASVQKHMSSPRLRHHLSSVSVEFETPERARTQGYYVAVTEGGPDHWGYYADVVVLVEGEWKIRARELRLEGVPGRWLDRHLADL